MKSILTGIVICATVKISKKRERGGDPMTDSERKKWEDFYEEAASRDFERAIYRRCAEEDEIREREP